MRAIAGQQRARKALPDTYVVVVDDHLDDVAGLDEQGIGVLAIHGGLVGILAHRQGRVERRHLLGYVRDVVDDGTAPVWLANRGCQHKRNSPRANNTGFDCQLW